MEAPIVAAPAASPSESSGLADSPVSRTSWRLPVGPRPPTTDGLRVTPSGDEVCFGTGQALPQPSRTHEQNMVARTGSPLAGMSVQEKSDYSSDRIACASSPGGTRKEPQPTTPRKHGGYPACNPHHKDSRRSTGYSSPGLRDNRRQCSIPWVSSPQAP